MHCCISVHRTSPFSPAISLTRSKARAKYRRRNTRGGGVTPYNSLYGEAPPDRGTFFRVQVCKRVEISQVKVYNMVGNSVI